VTAVAIKRKTKRHTAQIPLSRVSVSQSHNRNQSVSRQRSLKAPAFHDIFSYLNIQLAESECSVSEVGQTGGEDTAEKEERESDWALDRLSDRQEGNQHQREYR
jgi:hypothetical protein